MVGKTAIKRISRSKRARIASWCWEEAGVRVMIETGALPTGDFIARLQTWLSESEQEARMMASLEGGEDGEG